MIPARASVAPVRVNFNWDAFAYPEGSYQVHFWGVTGTIFGVTGQAITHVAGTSTSVYSTTSLVKEFMVRPDDGRVDQSFRFTNLNVPLVEGQRITVFGAGTRSDYVDWVRLIHHETEQSYVLQDAMRLAVRMNLAKSSGTVAVEAFFYALLAFIALLIASIVGYPLLESVVPDVSSQPSYGVRRGNGTAVMVAIAAVLGGPLVVLFRSYTRNDARSVKTRNAFASRVNDIAHQILQHVVTQKRSAMRQAEGACS